MMDRRRARSPAYSRQWSGGSGSTGSSSPMSSPAHPKSRLPPSATGMATVKRTQNVAAKAAAQRLAKVMASSRTPEDDDDDDEEEEDDDPGFRFRPPPPVSSKVNNGNSNGSNVALPAVSLIKPNRTPSPALGRNFIDLNPPIRSTSAGRPSMSVRTNTMADMPSSRSSRKTSVVIPPIELPRLKEKRFVPDLGQIDLKGSGNQPEAAALHDELDILQEENEDILDKLRHAEEKCEEAEARARELEKQVAALGEGISLEAKLLSRKEAVLQQKEAALKAASQTENGRDEEIAVLRAELKNFKDETATAVEQLREAESEAKAMRTMIQRMILTPEKMEELVLKRCWLARYWSLAVHYGICPDIAISKHEYWSTLAPQPFEVVISAGQKAREESCDGVDFSSDVDDSYKRKFPRDSTDLTADGNIEGMLSVEMGLRELASLKVEDAVMLAMAQKRHPNLVHQSSSDPRMSGDPEFMEAFELSQEESEDILFKQAWLMYFWRRAKVHGVEEDIAEERVHLWKSRNGQSQTPHDVVDVEQGLSELRKLGVERQLWGAACEETD